MVRQHDNQTERKQTRNPSPSERFIYSGLHHTWLKSPKQTWHLMIRTASADPRAARTTSKMSRRDLPRGKERKKQLIHNFTTFQAHSVQETRMIKCETNTSFFLTSTLSHFSQCPQTQINPVHRYQSDCEAQLTENFWTACKYRAERFISHITLRPCLINNLS